MNISYIRKNIGLTQQQLADKAGLNIRQVQKFEGGERLLSKASAGTVLKLAAALGTTVEMLLEDASVNPVER